MTIHIEYMLTMINYVLEYMLIMINYHVDFMLKYCG